MKGKWTTSIELTVILLVAAVSFLRGRQAALAMRGSGGYGGECLLLLLPVVYYVWKQIAADWLRDFREMW